MHFHLPKPLHGWREFIGEVGIIVIGVLIALGAEQVVETIHWKHEVGETRKALDGELSRDVAAFNWRWKEIPCAAARVDEIDRWAASLSDGHPLKLKGEITAPTLFAIRTSVWGATNGEVSTRMPVELKLAYAGLYDSLALYQQIQSDESEAWSVLTSYEDYSDLTREERHEIRRALDDIRSDNNVYAAFRARIDETAAKLNIRPLKKIEAGVEDQVVPATRALCDPLLPAIGKAT